MADTGRQSPLGVNVLGSVLQNTGLMINPVAAAHMGASKRNPVYSFGSCVSATCLRLLTWAIHDAYNRGVVLKSPAGTSVYDNIISIGLRPVTTIPALGNSRPPTYVPTDPAGVWARKAETPSTLSYAEQYGIQTGYPTALPGPATSGYGNYDPSIPYGDDLQGEGITDQKQNATWYPYDMTNPNHSVTQWGWIRCHALQAWNEFNWNGTVVDPADPTLPSYLQGYTMPEYKEFCASYMTMNEFVNNSDQTIHVIDNSETFLDGVYSNMNDLISADIAGVNLSSYNFGTDLSNLGKVINLKKIETFGMPSNLLMNIGAAGALTQDLGLSLLAAGLSKEEVEAISNGIIPNWSKELEQKIFGAFLIITGENLAHILAPLQCKTRGLDTLADLLNVQKLFPNSYNSMTVPVYNSQLGLPTNSKTYYLIYQNGGINPALSSQAIKDYVGTIIPRGLPPTYNEYLSPNNFVTLPKGFNSYLDGIIPNDWAVAAGAFSYAIRQIRNIENLNFETLASVATGIEGVTDLPLTSGTSKPTDQGATDDSRRICSLGSGQAGTYTMSDLFGCMSGLPYPWKLLQSRILQAQTQKLNNIYDQLFLAVTWESAVITVIPETRQVPIPDTDPVQYTTEYRVGSFVIEDNGGGYYRGKAPPPNITCDNGGTGLTTIGMNNGSASSLGGGTYGRVQTATVTDSGAWQSTIPVAYIECPPTADLPVTAGGEIASEGTNTPAGTTGWGSPMNSVVQKYIDQANAEISSIMNSKTSIVKYLNEYWNILGKQMVKEQRARYTCSPPVPVSKDYFLNPYPVALYSFLDAMPELSQDTRPHMSAQTLEAISDMSKIGGQSIVGQMRQERNQRRLAKLGIEPDNNIANKMRPTDYKTVTTNGTVSGAISGSGISSPTGQEYTIPAWPGNETTEPKPAGYYTSDGFQPTSGYTQGDITPIIEGNLNPVVNNIVPAGPVTTAPSPIDGIVIIAPPDEFRSTNLPPNIDPKYTNSTLMPAALTVPEAIEKVIECNCDCWVQ